MTNPEHPTLFPPPPRRGNQHLWSGSGGIGGHTRPNQGSTDIWLTPPTVINQFGPFDLDPCAAPEPRPWPTAAVHWTLPDHDGLTEPWTLPATRRPFVWLNPPYGPETGWWLEKLAVHGHGLALTFARTETKAFHEWVWPYATGVFFFNGRLHFHHPDGRQADANAGGPSVLIGYGPEAARRLSAAPATLGKWLPNPDPVPPGSVR